MSSTLLANILLSIGSLALLGAVGLALVTLALRKWLAFKASLASAVIAICIALAGGALLPDDSTLSSAHAALASKRSLVAAVRAQTHKPLAPTEKPATPTPQPTQTTIMQGLDLGDTAVVGSKPLPCFNSADAIEPFLSAAVAGDKIGEQEALVAALIASPGDHILMLDTSASPFAIGAVRVRLTSGANAEQACWLEGDLAMSALTHHIAKN